MTDDQIREYPDRLSGRQRRALRLLAEHADGLPRERLREEGICGQTLQSLLHRRLVTYDAPRCLWRIQQAGRTATAPGKCSVSLFVRLHRAAPYDSSTDDPVLLAIAEIESIQPALVGERSTGSLIVMRTGDRIRVWQDPDRVAAAIQAAACGPHTPSLADHLSADGGER